ncbi:hypothetical protein H6F86_18430 [Phormidium sp. FACHB-592]|uniref:Uncharacterized protein n=1 Tax=Stenomitos frigidus AS-A4 TaxID=2933935 RepID=A0ABV0KRZ9_9CYAN|nr:hypothetical protein [Phormidium sp. FACHB-592]MBD2075832.1 hypothetical protein [Phormidium sp. FACHB-592]
MFKPKKGIYRASVLAFIGIVSLNLPASLAQERTTNRQTVQEAESLPNRKQQNCIDGLIAQSVQSRPEGRQSRRVVNLQIAGNDRETLGGDQLRITSSGITDNSFTVLDPNNREVRKAVIQRSSNLRRASLRYTSPLGTAQIDKEGLRIVRNTFRGNQALERDYLRFQTALLSETREQRNRLSSLVQPSRSASQPPNSTRQSPLTTVDDLVNPTEPNNDIECEFNNDGKCVCDCDHGWNAFGALFCLGFTIGCAGDFIELSCEANSSQCG